MAFRDSGGGRQFEWSPDGAEDRQLVIDTSEQAALTRIEELWRAGASLRAMARILSAEGYRPKRSDRWHPESLRRIIGRLPPRDAAG
jgi:Recombinase